LGASRNFAEDFSSMQEMPMECGLLARVGAASRCVRKKIRDVQERRAGVGIVSSRAGKGRKKFFCIIAQNPLPIAPERVESRESAVSRFATPTSRVAIETIESLKNARHEVGDAAERRRSASRSRRGRCDASVPDLDTRSTHTHIGVRRALAGEI